MLVKELIELLKKQDPEAEIVSEGPESWVYNIIGVDKWLISNGHKVDEDGEECLVIEIGY